MSDDYLWDKSGKPDPEVAKLERVLSPLGHRDRPLELPVPGAPEAPAPKRGGGIIRLVWGQKPALPGDMRLFGIPVRAWAVAASVLAVAGAVTLWIVTHGTKSWEVASLEGAPHVGRDRVATKAGLAVGEWLETDAVSRARLTVPGVGEMLIEPNTRLHLLDAGDDRQRLHLAVGTLTAVIVAPPRQFVIETPSARAVDLGCAYTLEVDPQGGALVTVLVGWVSFEVEGRESFIPAGARCATRPGSGPGTPYFTDAPNALKNGLALLGVAADEGAHSAALATVLAAARREDAFTLWHLLARLKGADRDQVYARMALLVPPPQGVTREGVMAGDQAMLDRWWAELGFGEMKWWRLWQRGWPRPGADSAAGPGNPS